MKIVKGLLLGGISLAVSAAVWTAGSAWAQQAPTYGPAGEPGQRPQREERPNLQQPPNVLASESYDPLGIQVGSFKLFPVLELDEVYNDNIYATSTNKTGSFIQLIKPSVDLRSDWSRHMLNFFANGTFGLYSADYLSNYQDVSVGTDGRVDIQRDWNVYGGASWNRRHEERGTPNTVTTVGVPVNIYNQLVANVGYFQRFNRLSARLDGRMDNYVYQNQGPGPAAGTIFNSDRNRTEFRESGRVGFEFSPGFEVWTRGGLNQRTYVNYFDSQGFIHDSTGWDVVGGVAVDLGGITSFEAFAGYTQQNYVDSRFPVISAPTFGLTGYWNPIREVVVKPFVRRTVEDSALTNTSAYLSTVMGVDADYSFRPNVKASGHFDYAIADYSSVQSSNNGEYDQYFTFRADVLYTPTRNFFVGPRYQFVHRNSNLVGLDYDQNVVMLRLGARL